MSRKCEKKGLDSGCANGKWRRILNCEELKKSVCDIRRGLLNKNREQESVNIRGAIDKQVDPE